jgi:hypothetical protein
MLLGCTLLHAARQSALQLLLASRGNGPSGQIDKRKRNTFIIYPEAVTMHFIFIQFDPTVYFV